MVSFSGESAEVPQSAVDDWTKRLPDICAGYALKDIFNADETGLYYRSLPRTSLVHKNDDKKGIKTAKERMTVLLACSATGEKLKPLLIGKSENPRCFKNVHKSSLGVEYAWNRKSWMTAALFTSWLNRVNNRMKAQERRILLLVDNCAAHPHIELSNIKLVFLPPNTTSKLQPLDGGIIAQVKALYRKRMLRHLLVEMDEVSTATQLAKSITLLDAVRWLGNAWFAIKPSTCVKCFAHCGLVDATTSSSTIEEQEEVLLEEPYHQLLDGVTWESYIHMDDAVATVSTEPAFSFDPPADAESEHEDEEAEPEPIMSSKEALEQVKRLLAFVTVKGDNDAASQAMKLVSSVEEIRLKEKSKATQKTISDYFSCRSP